MKKYFIEFEIIILILLLISIIVGKGLQLHIQNQNKLILKNQEIMLIELNSVERKIEFLSYTSLKERAETLLLIKQIKEGIEESEPLAKDLSELVKILNIEPRKVEEKP